MHTLLQPFTTTLWVFVSVLFLFMLLAAVLRSRGVKGYLGECKVRWMLRRGLDRQQYTCLHNVTLKTTGGSTQIDHVVVSRFGLFAIETKNMRGWITGTEHQAEWTQQLFRRRFSFQNPLRQNYKHTKALEATLQIAPHTIHSVVAFVGYSHFPKDMPPQVTQGRGCVRWIQSFTQPVWDDQQVADLLLELHNLRLAPTRSTHQAHKAHVATLRAQALSANGPAATGQSDPNRPTAASVTAAGLVHTGPLRGHARAIPSARSGDPTPCPAASSPGAPGADSALACTRCGSAMVQRTARTGANAGGRFWGCSTFPRCRHVESL